MNRNKYVDALLYFLGSPRDHRIESRLGAFSEKDWFELITVSQVHKVAPILYRQLKSKGLGKNLPGWVLRRLGALYLLSANKQGAVVSELFKVFTKLKEDGVYFIVLKGPHLAEIIYRDWALRPMGDLDILVKEEQLSRVYSSLYAMGYFEEAKQTPAMHHHLPPLSKKGSLPIEIHLNISSSEQLSFPEVNEMFWQKAQSTMICGVEVLVLKLEDLLLNLSLHACQHYFRIGLIHVFDIYELLRRYKNQINYTELVSCANLLNSTKALYLTLEVVRKLLNISVPEKILDDLKPQDFSIEVMKGAEFQILETEFLSPKIVDLAETGGLWAKIKLIYEALFSIEVVSAKYPVKRNPRLVGYYYTLHLRDLIFRYIKLGPKVFILRREELIKPEKMARLMQKWLSTV